MTFDRIDRMFAKPKPALIRLECVSCGAMERVACIYPLWDAGAREQVPLCDDCAHLTAPRS